MPVSIEQIAQDEPEVSFQPGDSYLYSYREFVLYFAGVGEITSHHLVVGTHMAYGWMPIILKLRNVPENMDTAVTLLNAVRHGDTLSVAGLTTLKNLINNSMVGPSKLLHFINPRSYAIWDRRVCRYLNADGPPYYQIDSPDSYLAYLKLCKEISQDSRFPSIHASMNSKIGYTVTAFRALELVMFMSSRE